MKALLLGQGAFLALAITAVRFPHYWAHQREPLQTVVLLFQIWLSRRATLPRGPTLLPCPPPLRACACALASLRWYALCLCTTSASSRAASPPVYVM